MTSIIDALLYPRNFVLSYLPAQLSMLLPLGPCLLRQSSSNPHTLFPLHITPSLPRIRCLRVSTCDALS